MLVTFGETMLRYSPPPGERLETTDDLAVHVGGAESNVAVAAARLGADAAWASKLPESPLGRRVVAGLRGHGVEALVTWTDEGRQGTYYAEPGGEPRGTRVVYDRADAAVTTATPEDLAAGRVRDADVVHTSGITPALSERLARTTATLLETASSAGATVSFDVNYRSKLWSRAAAREALADLLPLVDVLFVAERDARAVLDRDGDAAVIAADLADDHDARTAVVTRGDDGAVACHEGAVHEQPAFAAETVDPIGSGDAFVGGFLAGRLDGESVPSALARGTATAALKRTVAGDVATVTPAEVRRVLDGDHRAVSR